MTSNAMRNAVTNGTPYRPVPTRPDPAYKGALGHLQDQVQSVRRASAIGLGGQSR